MTRAQFLAEMESRGIKTATISEQCPDDNNGLASYYWLISDSEDSRKRFCTPSVKLTRREYLARSLAGFEVRRIKAERKYKQWAGITSRP